MDDIPFVQDGTRDGEHVRGWMTQRFREDLTRRPEPWIAVTGSHQRRLTAAVTHIDNVGGGSSDMRAMSCLLVTSAGFGSSPL